MDRIIASNSVPQAQADAAPTTGTPQFASSGNLSLMLPGTSFPPYQYNAIQEELIGIITRAGIATDRTNNGQVLAALISMLASAPVSFSGSGTVAVPTWSTRALYEAWGGGGAGGSGLLGYAGAGGDGGGYSWGVLSVAPGAIISYSVGAGGLGNTGAGNAGGSTVFDGATVATGGGGGGAGTSSGVGVGANAPGTGTGSIAVASGGPGQNGLNIGGVPLGGSGGNTPFGASRTINPASASASGQFPGGGGSGGVAAPGASGAAGTLRVRFLP